MAGASQGAVPGFSPISRFPSPEVERGLRIQTIGLGFGVSPVADWLVGFFEGLVLDLDGCELRFRSLRVVADELELGLGVRVRSFPSLDINF